MTEMETIKRVLRDIVVILFCILLSSFILALITNLFYLDFNTVEILRVFDQYLKLVLTSWPASVIIIGSLLLLKQQGAIDEFIRKRITSIGPSGVNAAFPVASDASEKEIKTKAVEDIRQVTAVGNKSPEAPPSDSFNIEENVQKTIPNSKSQDFLARLKKVRAIEEQVQVYLLAKYGEVYRPNIKLTKGSSSVILDGLLTSKKSKLWAVEIRYIGASKKSEALKYIMIRLRDKLRAFGVKKLLLILVADDINVEDATKIKEMLAGLTIIEFYNFKNGTIEPVIVPDTEESKL